MKREKKEKNEFCSGCWRNLNFLLRFAGPHGEGNHFFNFFCPLFFLPTTHSTLEIHLVPIIFSRDCTQNSHTQVSFILFYFHFWRFCHFFTFSLRKDVFRVPGTRAIFMARAIKTGSIEPKKEFFSKPHQREKATEFYKLPKNLVSNHSSDLLPRPKLEVLSTPGKRDRNSYLQGALQCSATVWQSCHAWQVIEVTRSDSGIPSARNRRAAETRGSACSVQVDRERRAASL